MNPERNLILLSVLTSESALSLDEMILRYLKLDSTSRQYANNRTAEKTKRCKARIVGFLYGLMYGVACTEHEAEQLSDVLIERVRARKPEYQLPFKPIFQVYVTRGIDEYQTTTKIGKPTEKDDIEDAIEHQIMRNYLCFGKYETLTEIREGDVYWHPHLVDPVNGSLLPTHNYYSAVQINKE